MTSNKPTQEASLAERVRDITLIQNALNRAVRDALQMHKRMGNPICGWRDGQIVWIQPEDIPTPEELDGGERR